MLLNVTKCTMWRLYLTYVQHLHIMGTSLFKHYDNWSMQYTAISHSCKNDNFQMENCDVLLIFGQTIDHGYGSNEYPQSMFKRKNKK